MSLNLAEEDYLSEFAPINEVVTPPGEPILPCERRKSPEADDEYLDDPDFVEGQDAELDVGTSATNI